MEDTNKENGPAGASHDIRSLVRGAIEEFMTLEHAKAEPAYKAELLEERKKREQLERRINELAEENDAAGSRRKRSTDRRRSAVSCNV